MREDLDKALVRDFPNLYADRNAPMQLTAMCWGFSCGSGWEPLIRELSSILEAEILTLPDSVRERVKASQVKEKFGTLRFYMTYATEEMYKIINEFQQRSATICEECGALGSEREQGRWLMTRCDECFEK